MGILQIVITLAIAVLLVFPMGKYIYKVISGEKSFADPVMDKIDNFLYKITGIKREEMNWKQYIIALLLTNAVMAFFVYLIFNSRLTIP
jgi:potassium-transporting ATPase potassium-binding subunit